jgi:RNA polymerase sigma-70 factor (ECF subfamily)
MSDTIEQALLVAAQGGDKDAYDTLYLRLEPDIRRFVRRLLGGAHDALDDIVQETFVRAYMHLHDIDPTRLRPYLFRIARNRTYDILRRGQRRDHLSLDDEPVQVHVSFNQAEHQIRPDDAAHWLLLHLEVREAMDGLPEAQREALILFSEEQLSYAEIAETMGCSVGTVKSRIYHAKRNLRGLLAPATLELLAEEFGDSEKSSTPMRDDAKTQIPTL